MNHATNPQAPLSRADRTRIERDAKNPQLAVSRKGIMATPAEIEHEKAIAERCFDLGCWLFYYSRRIKMHTDDGFKARVDCARRLFQAGIFSPSYDFHSIFDFGERQFDTIFEMGDSDQIILALRQMIPEDPTGNLLKAFSVFQWDPEPGSQYIRLRDKVAVEAVHA